MVKFLVHYVNTTLNKILKRTKEGNDENTLLLHL